MQFRCAMALCQIKLLIHSAPVAWQQQSGVSGRACFSVHQRDFSAADAGYQPETFGLKYSISDSQSVHRLLKCILAPLLSCPEMLLGEEEPTYLEFFKHAASNAVLIVRPVPLLDVVVFYYTSRWKLSPLTPAHKFIEGFKNIILSQSHPHFVCFYFCLPFLEGST